LKKYLNQQDMKDRNYTNVLRLIRKSGPLTRRQIEAETGLSWGAVSNVTAHLIELGYIRECKEPLGAVPPGVGAGRIPIYLEADKETHFVIGMDINASGFRAVMMNLCGEVVETVRAPARYADREALLASIHDLTREILDYADGKHILCIGIAMQGMVDTKMGISIHFPHCSGWKDVPLAAILENSFGLPVFLEHDPDCMLYAYSVPSGIHEAILLRIDRGIGMAVMMNGRIFERLGAFELGYTVLGMPGEGSGVTLEQYATVTGIAERAGMPFDTCVSLARRGDSAAVRLFSDMADALAIATVNSARLLNISEIVLCGDLLLCRDLFYDRMLSAAERLSEGARIDFRVTDVAGAARGGAMIALERFALKPESV
jgi:predicted NBD/HSP70 family sugar kinase